MGTTCRTSGSSPFVYLVGGLLLTATFAGGCGGPPPPPRGSAGGRLDPYSTVPGEERSKGANLAALLEFCDGAAEQLAGDLDGLPGKAQATSKWVLAMGDLNNMTNTPTGDFELIQTRLRGKLVNSKLIRQHFVIVADRNRTKAMLNKVTESHRPPPDLLQEGSGAEGPAGVREYEPDITYVLQGDFHEANRGGKRLYYFGFTLTNLASGNIVFEKQYDLAQGNF